MTREIALTRGFVALVDDEDYERIACFNWQIQPNGRTNYASRRCGPAKNRRKELMHRVIMGTPDDMETDHLNGDGLDNRKANLRVCTPSENQHNKRHKHNGTSKYKGVCRAHGKWQADIKHPGIGPRYLGSFLIEEEAARAYDIAARELYGEFARTNF